MIPLKLQEFRTYVSPLLKALVLQCMHVLGFQIVTMIADV